MRKASTLVGLTVFALAATARAQQPAPGPLPPPVAPPAAAPAAETTAPAPAPEQSPSERKLLISAALLPMGMGTYTSEPGGMREEAEAAFGVGIGLSAGYVVTHGLVLGIAPQVIFNVKGREASNSAKEVDLMARVAYMFPLSDALSLYAEFLPGYSLLLPAAGDSGKGFVFAFGAGAIIDVTERVFASMGAGWQYGYQKRKEGMDDRDLKTDFLRVSVGVGMRF